MCEHKESNKHTYGIDKGKKFSQMFKSNHGMLGVEGMTAIRRCKLAVLQAYPRHIWLY